MKNKFPLSIIILLRQKGYLTMSDHNGCPLLSGALPVRVSLCDVDAGQRGNRQTCGSDLGHWIFFRR